MEKYFNNATNSLIVSSFCIAFLLVAPPLLGRKFEHWPLLAGIAYLIVILVLPVSSVSSVVSSYKAIASGNKNTQSKLLLTLSIISCLFFMAYVVDFTSGP